MRDSIFQKLDWLLLPLVGFGAAVVLWQVVSQTISRDLPSLNTDSPTAPFFFAVSNSFHRFTPSPSLHHR